MACDTHTHTHTTTDHCWKQKNIILTSCMLLIFFSVGKLLSISENEEKKEENNEINSKSRTVYEWWWCWSSSTQTKYTKKIWKFNLIESKWSGLHTHPH